MVDVGQLISSENTHLFEFGIFKDLNSKRPGLADTVRRFFTVYKVFIYFFIFDNILRHHWLEKVPSGKGENRFAYNGEFKDNQLAMDVIRFHFNLNGLVSFQICAGVFYPVISSRCRQVPAHLGILSIKY